MGIPILLAKESGRIRDEISDETQKWSNLTTGYCALYVSISIMQRSFHKCEFFNWNFDVLSDLHATTKKSSAKFCSLKPRIQSGQKTNACISNFTRDILHQSFQASLGDVRSYSQNGGAHEINFGLKFEIINSGRRGRYVHECE